MRPIDVDALKEILTKKVFHELSDEFYGTMQALDEAPTIDVVPMWIPCDERLPEYLDYVLLSSPEYGLKIGARARKSNVNSWYLDEPLDCDVWHVILSNSWYDLEDFIAWMPLPEPYDEERKDNETN